MKAIKTPSLSVSLEPSPQAAEGVSLLQQAQGIVVIDRASHEICRGKLKFAKQVDREMEAHYDQIKKPINAAKAVVLDMEKKDRGPVQEVIRLLTAKDTTFVREQEARERAEADARRREAEAVEQARRDKEAAEAEEAALELEASAHNLSDRERRVVEMLGPLPTPADWLKACRLAGYKDFKVAAARLFDSAKIQQAIENHRKALEIRLQSEAAKSAPILVETPVVETQVATVAGTSVRTYFACDPQVDLRKLAAAVLAGTVPLDAIQPNMVHLNAQARSLKAMFPQAYPGTQLSKRDGVTG